LISKRDVCDVPLAPYHGRTILCASDQPLRVIGTLSTTIVLQGRQFAVTFLVAEGRTPPLLGRDFQKKYKVTVSHDDDEGPIILMPDPAEPNSRNHLLFTCANVLPMEEVDADRVLILSESYVDIPGDADEPADLPPIESELTKKQRAQVIDLIKSAAFATDPSKPGVYQGPEFTIETGDAKPLKCHPRRASPDKELELQRHVSKMLDNGIIEPAASPWSSPVVLARKK